MSVAENREGPVNHRHHLTSVLRSPAGWLFLLALGGAFVVGRYVPATWTVERITLDIKPDDVKQDAMGRAYFEHESRKRYLDTIPELPKAQLGPERVRELSASGHAPETTSEYAFEEQAAPDRPGRQYYQLKAMRHWRYWSLLPAVVAIALCWMTREPLIALLGGAVVGAFLLGEYDFMDGMLVQRLASKEAATVLVLYLWLLGGLMGVWSRTGASQAFADFMTRRFVRGPRSAKLVAWLVGVIFFQGGSISAALVGSTVKPVADRERVSHEELSYIVDSTASPIASLLAFNAWPIYVQGFIYVAGVPWLETEAKRITFFFASIPICFYAIFAVIFTLLMSLEYTPFIGRRMRLAIRRARETGQLDAPGAEPLRTPELETSHVPPGYVPHVAEFFLPLGTLIAIAVGTFIIFRSPKVSWAFAGAILLASAIALGRGMRLKDLMAGYLDGFKSVVLGSVILLLAVVIGGISRDAGSGAYLVDLVGGRVPYWLLPVILQLLTMIIAFSTGTSWGTYAVSFPLAMPLAWEVANANALAHPQLFMMICFAAVMDGSVYGDQCSPISDTTVLSAMTTGCDLMDHVRTQIPQATLAAILAAAAWTVMTLTLV